MIILPEIRTLKNCGNVFLGPSHAKVDQAQMSLKGNMSSMTVRKLLHKLFLRITHIRLCKFNLFKVQIVTFIGMSYGTRIALKCTIEHLEIKNFSLPRVLISLAPALGFWHPLVAP